MECDSNTKNGQCVTETWRRWSSFGIEDDGVRQGQLDVDDGLSSATRRKAMVSIFAHRRTTVVNGTYGSNPFMNTMDEISYWIFTKRAPCLMDYDSVTDKHSDEAHCSKYKQKSVPSVVEVPSPKKKKRKLSLLDDDSGSGEKQLNNIYFDNPQTKKQAAASSCKSTLRSDIDFNIKIPSVEDKQKLAKCSKAIITKKKKLVTSTPKVQQPRRSLRQAKLNLNNNCQLNGSFNIFTTNSDQQHIAIEETPVKTKPSSELLAGGDQTTDNKITNNKPKDPLNGQFEDISDVSGFTANYIRSTKVRSAPRKLRCKNNRALVKASQQTEQKDDTMVVYMDKSINTPYNNCSSETVNVVNLVTTKSAKSAKVSKSTSLLKFMNLRTVKEEVMKTNGTRKTKGILNVSFESKTSSRYPKRHLNNSKIREICEEPFEQPSKKVTDSRRKISKNSSEFNNSDRKENPEETNISRTRSGRSIGLTLRHPENSVLVLSNSTEQVSSMTSINVASPTRCQRGRKKKRITRPLRSRKDIHGTLHQDSLRDKSGFTACFSDSEDDSEPLKQGKFFCV